MNAEQTEQEQKLEQAKAALAENAAAIVKAETEIQAATDLIALALDVSEAQKLITDRAAAQALIAEFLKPQALKLAEAVTAAQETAQHVKDLERAAALALKRDCNVEALNATGRDLVAALKSVEDLALAYEARGKLLAEQSRETVALASKGCPVQTTVQLEQKDIGCQTLVDALKKADTPSPMVFTREFTDRLAKVGAYKEEQ